MEGESGYLNLMKVKAGYFENGGFPQLMKNIDASCKPFEKRFREELFDKLYDFFQHHFSESDSIYFRNTPNITTFTRRSTRMAEPYVVSEISYNDPTVDLTWTTAALALGITVKIQQAAVMENGSDGMDEQVINYF